MQSPWLRALKGYCESSEAAAIHGRMQTDAKAELVRLHVLGASFPGCFSSARGGSPHPEVGVCWERTALRTQGEVRAATLESCRLEPWNARAPSFAANGSQA